MPNAAHGALAIAVAESGNEKIGDCATTYAAQTSCPTWCAFYNGGGCYAENGRIFTSSTGPLNENARDAGASAIDVARAEATAIDRLPAFKCHGRPLRLHTVGDCSSDACAQIVAAAADRYRARGGGPVWSYTHAWRIVERASWGAVSILASCETPEQVELAHARGYATALVVAHFATRRLHETCRTAPPSQPGVAAPADVGALTGQRPGGGAPVTSAAILPCPAQTRDDVACSSCRLCMNDQALLERGYSIGFEVHGTAFTIRQARAALAAPSDERRRLTLRQLIPEYLAAHPGASSYAIARDLGYAEASVIEMRHKLDRQAA